MIQDSVPRLDEYRTKNGPDDLTTGRVDEIEETVTVEVGTEGEDSVRRIDTGSFESESEMER